MKILITGANGFLGSTLTHYFLSRGEEVISLVRQGAVLDRLKVGSEKIVFFKEFADLDGLINSIEPDVLIHTAGSYGRTKESSIDLKRANFDFGKELVERLATVKKKCLFINVGTVLASSVSAYAESKNRFTEWAEIFFSAHNGELSCFNIAMQQMYGIGDDEKKLPMRVIAACLNNAPEMDMTTGEQLRDFIYIKDVLSAFGVLINHGDTLKGMSTIPVGSGTPISVKQFVLEAKNISGSHIDFKFGRVPLRENEPMCLVADTTKLKSLGWRPLYDVRQGLTEIFSELKVAH